MKYETIIKEVIELINDNPTDIEARIYAYADAYISTFYPDISRQGRFNIIGQAFKQVFEK